jgi:hypothetical protein
VDWIFRKIRKKKINVVIFSQEMEGNASLPTVTNPTVINFTEVSGPTRVSEVYLLRNKLFLGKFFPSVLQEVDWIFKKIRKKKLMS